MLKTRKLVAVLVLAVLAVGGFLAGRATAQQATPREHTAFHTFPRAWGALITVNATPGGFVYFFESTDGVRSVRVGVGGIDDIELIKRTGSAPAESPGRLR
jgi:hypothetical protein